MFSAKTVIAIGLGLLTGAAQAPGAVLLHSSFETGTEGWSIGSFFAPISILAEDYVAAGGQSGGFLQTEDLFGNNSFRAPASWLGNQSALFGAVLRFYQRAEETDGLVSPVVVLASDMIRLQYRMAPPGTDWTEYNVTFRAGDWEVGNGSGRPGSRLATDAELLQVLSNLDWLAFSGDWHTGADLVGIDEVSISTLDVTPVIDPPPRSHARACFDDGRYRARSSALAFWRRRSAARS